MVATLRWMDTEFASGDSERLKHRHLNISRKDKPLSLVSAQGLRNILIKYHCQLTMVMNQREAN